ncbi:MAG TPA: hypothetical protein P5048_02910 [Chlamydiales bacterium]|nr:hypothetical protein [Chlamydiales bacterium]
MSHYHFTDHLKELSKKKRISESEIGAFEKLTAKQKQKIANEQLLIGKEIISTKPLEALKAFEIASHLSPTYETQLLIGKTLFEEAYPASKIKVAQLASKYLKKALAIEEKSEAFHLFGKTLYLLGKSTGEITLFEKGIDSLKKAISLNTEDVQFGILNWDLGNTWSALSQLSGEAIDIKQAIQAFSSASKYFEIWPTQFTIDYAQSCFQMGLLINDNRLYFQAIDFYNQTIKNSTQNADTYRGLANCYTELYINSASIDYFENADTYYAKALEKNIDDAGLWLEWAQLLGEAGRQLRDARKLRQSIEKIIRAYRIQRNRSDIIAQWVESLANLGAISGRLDLIQEAEERISQATKIYKSNSEIWYAYGICMRAYAEYYDDLEYEEFAIEKFNYALSIESCNSEFWHGLALSYFALGKHIEAFDILEKAESCFLRAIDLKPSCPSLIFDYAKNSLFLGEITQSCEKIQEAISTIEKLLNNQQDALLQHPSWLYTYAKGLKAYGDITGESTYIVKAIEVFQNVLLIDPDYPKLHFHIALTYSALADDTCNFSHYEKSTNFFRLATKQSPEDEVVWLEWGLSLISYAECVENAKISNQLLSEARQKLNKSGQLGNEHSYYHLACLESIQNNTQEAMKLLQKAHQLEMLPTLEEIMEDTWLENVRSTDAFSLFLSKLEKEKQKNDLHS